MSGIAGVLASSSSKALPVAINQVFERGSDAWIDSRLFQPSLGGLNLMCAFSQVGSRAKALFQFGEEIHIPISPPTPQGEESSSQSRIALLNELPAFAQTRYEPVSFAVGR